MKAKIYRPSRSAMQSGKGKTKNWVLEYETLSARRPEALMGWTASEDTLNQVRLRFETLEAARAFADKKGFAYTVLNARDKKIRPRNYGDNFKYFAEEDA